MMMMQPSLPRPFVGVAILFSLLSALSCCVQGFVVVLVVPPLSASSSSCRNPLHHPNNVIVTFSSIKDDNDNNHQETPTIIVSSRSAITSVKDQPIESLLRADDLRLILTELLADKSLLDDTQALITKNWNSLESKLRNETRSLRELLGPRTTDAILRQVQKINEYDPQTVQSFLSTQAMNDLLTRILYDGIFEFFQKIDVFGNIVNNLPIIGPIRKQIVQETKRQLDRSLGPLVQNFLATYSQTAVKEAVDFILSPENRQSFGNANAKLVASVLDRPLNSLFLSEGMGEKWINTTFDSIRQVDSNDDFDQYIDFVYENVGHKSIGSVVDVDRVMDASPTLERTLDRLWSRALEAHTARPNKQ